MILTLKRILPDGIIDWFINLDYLIHAYKVTVNEKKSCLVKMEDCDLIELTEESFDKLIEALYK